MSLSVSRMLTIGILPSFFKKAYYRSRGAKIGKGVSLGLFSTIEADRIVIGDNSKIGMLVQIKAKEFIMGAYSEIRTMTVIEARRVRIGNETIIMEQVIVGGMKSLDSVFKIGDRCKVFPFCFINPTMPIVIGNDVGIGGSNFLFTHGSWSNSLEGFPISFGPITLEDRVWLPWRVFVLPNVTIGHDSVIAAGSVVAKSIPPLSLAAGIPARVKKTGESFVTKPSLEEKLEKLRSMFQKFEEYLRIEGFTVVNATDSALPLDVIWAGTVLNKNNELVGSVLVADAISDTVLGLNLKSPCYVSVKPMTEAMKGAVEEEGSAWFEIHSYQWGGSRRLLANELRVFLSRFGVRFESVDLQDRCT
jgi:acetyltransferase-like isoleucine patch superfamily enzyme